MRNANQLFWGMIMSSQSRQGFLGTPRIFAPRALCLSMQRHVHPARSTVLANAFDTKTKTHRYAMFRDTVQAVPLGLAFSCFFFAVSSFFFFLASCCFSSCLRYQGQQRITSCAWMLTFRFAFSSSVLGTALKNPSSLACWVVFAFFCSL